MKKILVFFIIGTLISLILISAGTLLFAATLIILAKVVTPQIITFLPYSLIGGIILSFALYGKIIEKIMAKCGIEIQKRK